MFNNRTVLIWSGWTLLLLVALLVWLGWDRQDSQAATHSQMIVKNQTQMNGTQTHESQVSNANVREPYAIIESCGSSDQSIRERDDPYPRSQYVSLEWAPTNSMRCAADESDNFVLTWTADNIIYSSYGDGYGVRPYQQEKLSMGFIEITGSAIDFDGENDLENSLETSARPDAQGRKGLKASGLISIDGVFYIWLRNVNRDGRWCQVARSYDGGRNWDRASWTFQEFGFCGFVNFGQDNAMPQAVAEKHGNYAYMYTHDEVSASAYHVGDGFIMARVPKDRIMDRGAYEFFLSRATDNTSANWTPDINVILENNNRRVFRHNDSAARSTIIYNPGLARYFWWQGYRNHGDNSDERLSGGFGVYDAPEPWGPWTTVYNVDNWDWGPGDLGTFPIKWISEDGLTMYLLFSGNDRLTVRRADLTLLITPTSTPTPTPPPPPTVTPTPSVTPKPTSTVTPTRTPTVTPTPTSTPTLTDTPQPGSLGGEATPTSTSTLTPTPSVTPTLTPTPYLDEDGDGIQSAFEGNTGASVPITLDTDEDGFLNFLDPDDDGDGVLTIYEFADPNGDGNPDDAIDTDGDQMPNYLDPDDDNDGVATSEEGTLDRNQNGQPDYLDASVSRLIYVPSVLR
ncbi:MAG: hypothetical protein AAF702_07915 [Chloroflexota bacterium]